MQLYLMYHDVYEKSYKESGFLRESTNQYKINAIEFERHVKAVTDYCKANKEIEVQFTFDDGGQSFDTIIAPILERYGVKGLFFISTKYVGTETFLTFDQLSDLKERGHTIGSHSHSHPNLAELNRQQIYEEWNKSISILKPFLSEEICASVPEGYSNGDVIEAASENSISCLFTSEPTLSLKEKNGMKIIGRYVVYEGMTADDVISIISDKKRRMRLKAKWTTIKYIKAILGRRYDTVKAKLYKTVLRRPT